MWKQFFRGSVRFETEDASCALINKLRKFKPRDIQFADGKLCFSVALIHKREVARMLGKRTTTVKEPAHIFAVLNFFYSRTALVITALVCIATFIVLDQFAFRIKVEGITGQEYAQVSAYLRENGITQFTYKSNKKAKAVAQKIVNEFDFVAAATARVSGAAIIFSVLRAENPAALPITGDITSPVDGVVTQIIALAGNPVVTVGDVVRTGDILVTGTRAMAIIYIHNGTELVCVINNTIKEITS